MAFPQCLPFPKFLPMIGLQAFVAVQFLQVMLQILLVLLFFPERRAVCFADFLAAVYGRFVFLDRLLQGCCAALCGCFAGCDFLILAEGIGLIKVHQVLAQV